MHGSLKSVLPGLLALVLLAGCAPRAGYRDPLGTAKHLPERHQVRYHPSPAAELPQVKRQVPQVGEEPLSVEECVDIALRHNPAVTVAWQRSRLAAAEVGMSRSAYWPQVEAEADAMRQRAQVLTEVEAEFLRTVYRGRVTMRQLLLDGGARRAEVEAAGWSLRASEFGYRDVLLQLVLTVEQACYRLRAAQHRLEVARQAVSQGNFHVKLAQRRYEAGLARESEIHQARSKRADATVALVESQNQVEVLRGRLASAMGLPPHTEVRLKPPEQSPLREHEAEVGRLLKMAAERRPDLKEALAEVERVRRKLEGARARNRPELNFSASYGAADTKLLPDGRPEWTLQLGLSFPLFTGFRTRYDVNRWHAELRRTLAGYRERFHEAELQVWEAYSALTRAHGAAEAAAVFVNSARETLRATEREYKQGKATIVELIDAQTALTRAQNKEISAELDRRIALARLRRAVGRDSYEESSTSRQAPAEHDPGRNSRDTGQ